MPELWEAIELVGDYIGLCEECLEEVMRVGEEEREGEDTPEMKPKKAKKTGNTEKTEKIPKALVVLEQTIYYGNGGSNLTPTLDSCWDTDRVLCVLHSRSSCWKS